jgi:hypothetical protein
VYAGGSATNFDWILTPPDSKVKGTDGKAYAATKPPNPRHVAKIERDGIADLRKLVADNKLSAADGARIAGLSAGAQDVAVAALKRGLRVKEAIAQAEEEESITPAPAVEEVPLDSLGIAIPEHARAAFADTLFDEARKTARHLADLIHQIAQTEAGYWFMRRCCGRMEATPGKVRFFHDGLKSLIHNLKAEAPYVSVCPWCYEDGKKRNDPNCKHCDGKTCLTKGMFEKCEEELQAAVKALATKGGAQ